MKKYISLLLVFIMSFIFIFGNVEAAEGYIIILDKELKSPETIPVESDDLRAILSEEFDFSKIKFSGTDGSEIVGKNDMRKILLTVNPDYANSDIKGENWFSAYCLDGNLKYPQYSLFNFNDYESKSNEMKMQIILTSALVNNPELSDVFKRAEGYIIDPVVKYADTTDVDAVVTAAAQALNNISFQMDITVDVESITYSPVGEGEDLVITAADLSGNAEDTVYPVKLTKDLILLDKYSMTSISNKNYNHAMWIMEHSYPTLNIREFVKLADVDYINLIADIAVLSGYTTETNKEEFVNSINVFDACVDKKTIAEMINKNESDVTNEVCEGFVNIIVSVLPLDNYIYSTVQYAIWKVTDGIDFNGNKLGDELIGSTELNKLYQYLVKQDVPDDYLTYEYKNTIDLVKPSDELYKDTKDYYIYGPYGISHDVVSLGEVNVSLDGNFDGVSIVDDSLDEINVINVGEEFFVKVLKSKNTANVAVKLSTDEAKTFFPNSNRGRIYYATYPKSQNVISGGKIVNTEIEKSFDLVFNPKTGQETFAIMFVVMLVLCSTAFVYVTYKNNPLRF